MQFSIKTTSSNSTKSPCAVIALQADGKLDATGQQIDAGANGDLSRALASGDLNPRAGSSLMVHLSGPIKRALVVSVGNEASLSEKAFNDLIRNAFRTVGSSASVSAVSWLHDVVVGQRSAAWKLRAQVMAARELSYRADQWKSKREPNSFKLTDLGFIVDKKDAGPAKKAIDQAQAIANGVDLAKDLGNAPPNICTPVFLGEQARKIGKVKRSKTAVKVQVMDVKQITALKMGSFLSVAQGSAQPPRLIVMEYRGGPAKQAPVALVGKGITFDTGGISLKPGAEMDEMKYDMCGAASVLGTLEAVAQLQLPINLIGIVVAAENMPSGNAVKPGDIVTSMSGQTIEILNTDAEGRLILCDALTYVSRFKPSTVIDIATLTGACVVALGAHHSGLFTANDQLGEALVVAGNATGDSCWPMPLNEEYHEGLKSNFADMANIAGRMGGAITAACFLSKFAKGYDWAHLDIAGTAWKSGAAKGATGRPVPLLVQYLIDRV